MLKIIRSRCVPESETLRLISVDISFSRTEAEIADAFIFCRHEEPVADFRQYRAFLDNIAVKAERNAAVGREFVINIGVDNGRAGGSADCYLRLDAHAAVSLADEAGICFLRGISEILESPHLRRASVIAGRAPNLRLNGCAQQLFTAAGYRRYAPVGLIKSIGDISRLDNREAVIFAELDSAVFWHIGRIVLEYKLLEARFKALFRPRGIFRRDKAQSQQAGRERVKICGVEKLYSRTPLRGC